MRDQQRAVERLEYLDRLVGESEPPRASVILRFARAPESRVVISLHIAFRVGVNLVTRY
jgi:hypothetical protein